MPLICPAIDTTFSHMWPVQKTVRSNTLAQEPASGRGCLYIPLYEFPLWDFKWTLGYIPGNISGDNTVAQQLINFLIGIQNRGQNFLFLDPYDNTVTNQYIGAADGSTTQFTMYRTILVGGGQDLIQNFVNPPSISVGGVLQNPTTYNIDAYGTLTFNTAPVLSSPPHAITWSGQFYFLCRMKKDSQESLQQTMYQLWEMKTFEFNSELN